MLPSKGYFSPYVCPFFENSSCERPYCHFHHKKRKTSTKRDGLSVEIKHKNRNGVASEVLKVNPKDLDRVEAPEYKNSSAISMSNDTTPLTYKPTPIAILKKRNTTGCNNYLQGIDEEISIKKQRTLTSNNLESINDSGFLPKQNFMKNEESTDLNSKDKTGFDSGAEHDVDVLDLWNRDGKSSNRISSSLLGISNANCMSLQENMKAEPINKCQSEIQTKKPESEEGFPKHYKNNLQNNSFLAGGESRVKVNDSFQQFQANSSDFYCLHATKLSLGPHGESLLNGILDGKKNEKYFAQSANEYSKENEYNIGLGRRENGNKSTPINESALNDGKCNYGLPRETYANIVKQEKNYFSNQNKYEFPLETYKNLNQYPNLIKQYSIISTEVENNQVAINNSKTSEKPLIYSDKNYNGTDLHSKFKDIASLNDTSIPVKDEKSSGNWKVREILSQENVATDQTSLLTSINVETRIAHTVPADRTSSIIPAEAPKRPQNSSPSQVLLERWKTANVLSRKNLRSSFEKIQTDNKETSTKMRIAYVPNVAALLAERQQITNSLCNSRLIKSNASNSSFGTRDLSTLKHDLIIDFVSNSKVPIIKRQNYLNKAVEFYSKLYSYDIAKTKALDAEKEICSASKTPTTYFNKFAQLFIRLKKEAKIKNEAKPTGTEDIHPPNLEGAYRESFYNDLLKYLMINFEDNGIPVPHTEKIGFAKMKKIYGVSSFNKSKSICINCLNAFEVDSKGFSIERRCKFHPGKMLKQKRKYGTEKIWTCCNRDGESSGCVQNEFHVRDMVDYDNIPGFKQTREPIVTSSQAFQVYAMDCEMCYTTEGSELTRCTVVDSNLNVVYDKLCVPYLPIIDYCTKFSGISKGDLDNVSTRLSDVQTDLLCLFNSKTILIGHGIGNDLKAVKLFHRFIIDTSEVYGNSRKHKKLSELTKEILHREIQNNGSGHDSCEDAIATMELMLVKVKEDKKTSKSRTGLNVNKLNNEN